MTTQAPLFTLSAPAGASIRPLWQFFADRFSAWENCGRILDNSTDADKVSNATDWQNRHADILKQAARDFLPSGSGFDNGTRFDFDGSRRDRLRFKTSFHHMTESGFYDGWSHHIVTLRPSFGFPDISISGKDRKGVKEYIADVFAEALRVRVALLPAPQVFAGAIVESVPEISTGDFADSAMSIWETVLERARLEYAPGGAGDFAPFCRTLSKQGYSATRQAFAGMVAACRIGWTLAAREGFNSCFDQEFCPAFILRAVEWNPDGAELPALRSDWREICREIGRECAAA